MKTDLHCHTDFSDGLNSCKEMVECALGLGYKKIAFTDHMRRESLWIDEYIKTVGALKKEYASRIEILCGAEARAIDTDGNIDILPEDAKKLDFVLGALHSFPVGREKFVSKTVVANEPEKYFGQFLNVFENLTQNKSVYTLAHPFALREIFKACWDIETDRRILEKLKAAFGVAEYNVKYYNPDFGVFPTDLKICVGSDSHSVEDMRERSKKVFEACAHFS